MLSITPCRTTISDRFPVASFVVQVPPQRVFEIACTTDPALFGGDRRGQRTPDNFFCSRAEGLLRAPAGQATYLLPPDQLRRFAGQRRLYYALASYADPRGSAPELTPFAQGAPFLSLSPDFTGRTLDRSRLRKPDRLDARYGASARSLSWGGDGYGAAAPAHGAPPPAGYDDGYPAELWTRGQEADGAHDPADPADPADPGLAPADGEPPGFEDAPALRAHQEAEAYGRRSYGGFAMRSPARAPPPDVRQPAGEPHGFEDAVALRAATTGASPDHGRGRAPQERELEPPGAADPGELRRGPPAFGGADDLRARLGDSGPPDSPAAAPAPAEAGPALFTPPGVDGEYDDAPDQEGPLPPCALESALSVLDKFRLAQPAAAQESGAAGYRALNADGEFEDPTHPAYQRRHYGLHWGLVQANQRSGALGRTLVACERRSPEKFRQTFVDRDELLSVTTAAGEEARLAPVAGSPLWREPWLARFREASAVPEFQAAQNEIAIEGYFDPNLSFADALGLDTDRALAMLYDRCVDMGNAAARRFVIAAVSPLRDDGAVASALRALGHDSPQSFQRSLGLAESPRLGPKAHAALLRALRTQPSAGAQAPSTGEMLDALVAASRGRRFERRVQALRTSSELSDSRRQVN